MTWCFTTSLQLPKGQLTFVEKWPLMNSNDMGFILITFLVFIFKIGPYIMEKRNPLQIKPVLVVFNAFKVFNSAYLIYKFFFYIRDKGLFPRNCDYDDSTIYTIAILYWKYMVTKLLDLIDTIFIVLRKNYRQLTFLHVYHHVFMVVITWSCLKYDPSDHWAFVAFMNSIVHTVMYGYYALAAMGPRFAKYLWWKRYLTILQLIQFVLGAIHLIVQTYTTRCPMSAGNYWIGLGNLTLFMILFTDFYKRSYAIKKPAEFACSRHLVDD